MTKSELASKLKISIQALESVIKSCGYTEIKNFNAVHETVIKSYIAKSGIKDYTVENIEENQNKKAIVFEETQIVEVVTVRRKELIELISRAYHKGFENGKNSIFIADKQRLEEIFEEALNG